jgi:hypothetical protein
MPLTLSRNNKHVCAFSSQKCNYISLFFVYAGVSVAVFASNCKKAGAQERSRYLEELMRYIPVRVADLFLQRCMRHLSLLWRQLLPSGILCHDSL